MVQLFGTSQSTNLIQEKLPQVKGYNFSTWYSIKTYYSQFQKILEERKTQETQDLDSNLAQLRGRKFKKLSKNYQSILQKRLEPYYKAYEILKVNQELYAGAIGEEAVIGILSKLSDSYYVFNDITLKLPQTVLWTKSNDYIRSAQIDHLLIGPSGVFIIETKNWKVQTLIETKFLPHYQVERARVIFELLTQRKLGSLPIYSTVVTLAKLPKVSYYGVDQINIRQLTPHILRRKKKLEIREIQKIVSWIKKQI